MSNQVTNLVRTNAQTIQDEIDQHCREFELFKKKQAQQFEEYDQLTDKPNPSHRPEFSANLLVANSVTTLIDQRRMWNWTPQATQVNWLPMKYVNCPRFVTLFRLLTAILTNLKHYGHDTEDCDISDIIVIDGVCIDEQSSIPSKYACFVVEIRRKMNYKQLIICDPILYAIMTALGCVRTRCVYQYETEGVIPSVLDNGFGYKMDRSMYKTKVNLDQVMHVMRSCARNVYNDVLTTSLSFGLFMFGVPMVRMSRTDPKRGIIELTNDRRVSFLCHSLLAGVFGFSWCVSSPSDLKLSTLQNLPDTPQVVEGVVQFTKAETYGIEKWTGTLTGSPLTGHVSGEKIRSALTKLSPANTDKYPIDRYLMNSYGNCTDVEVLGNCARCLVKGVEHFAVPVTYAIRDAVDSPTYYVKPRPNVVPRYHVFGYEKVAGLFYYDDQDHALKASIEMIANEIDDVELIKSVAPWMFHAVITTMKYQHVSYKMSMVLPIDQSPNGTYQILSSNKGDVIVELCFTATRPGHYKRQLVNLSATYGLNPIQYDVVELASDDGIAVMLRQDAPLIIGHNRPIMFTDGLHTLGYNVDSAPLDVLTRKMSIPLAIKNNGDMLWSALAAVNLHYLFRNEREHTIWAENFLISNLAHLARKKYHAVRTDQPHEIALTSANSNAIPVRNRKVFDVRADREYIIKELLGHEQATSPGYFIKKLECMLQTHSIKLRLEHRIYFDETSGTLFHIPTEAPFGRSINNDVINAQYRDFLHRWPERY